MAVDQEQYEALIDAARTNGHAELGPKPRRSRFASKGTVRLDLSEGDWIDVRSELTFAQDQRITDRSIKRVSAGDGTLSAEFHVDARNLAVVEGWLVDWSLRDEHGVKVPVSAESIAALDEDTGTEVLKAINGHILRLEEAKKVMTGGGESPEKS